MRIQKITLTILLGGLLVSAFGFSNVAQAKPTLREINQLERQIYKFQKKLDRLFAGLTEDQKRQFIESRNARLNDSDEDGVPDLYDPGLCNTDSDDDGLDDGDEYDNGTDPENSDTDGDGIDDNEDDTNDNIDDGDDNGDEDGEEVKTHGRIVGRLENKMKVNELYFVLTSETEILNLEEHPTGPSALVVGTCIYVKGHPGEGNLNVAERVKIDNHCD